MNKILTMVIAVAIAASAVAAPISESRARDIAASLLGKQTVATAPKVKLAMRAPRKGKSVTANASPAYYVFNNSEPDGGWVIVAGDDRAKTILGYSKSGSFNEESISDCEMWWLEMYASVIDNIDNLQEGVPDDPNTIHLMATNGLDIPPLLTCQWGQRAPFNFQCPQVGSNYCATGCVATAMAQVMYYYKWPQSSLSIPAYTPSSGSVKGVEQSALPATSFNWSAMKDFYSNSETSTTSTANAAVAKLMHYCGQAALMNYGVNSSGATTSQLNFTKYFKYNEKAKRVARIDYGKTTWEYLIYTELKNGRPVILSASKPAGGHSFVCDGYDGNGLFHINWGWYGSSDGYFAIDVLNPYSGGTGSIDGEDGYVIDLQAIIGLEPLRSGTSTENGETLTFMPFFASSSGDWKAPAVGNTTYTRSSSSSDFDISISGIFWNDNKFTANYNVAWGVYSGRTCKKVVYVHQNEQYTPTTLKYRTRTLSFGSNYSDGEYYIYPLSGLYGKSLQFVEGYRENYVKAVIKGNTVTLTPYSSDRGNLVGSSLSIDGTARVGHPLNFMPKVKNNAQGDYYILYLFIDNQLAGANSITISPGATATGSIHYTPTSAGQKNVRICSDEDGNNTILSTSFTVSESPTANLTLTPTVAYVTNGILPYPRALVGIKATNTSSNIYNDDIVIKVYKQASDGYYYAENSTTTSVVVPSKSYSNCTVLIPDLVDGERYIVRPFYYSNGSLVAGSSSASFLVRTLKKGDVNADSEVNVGDISTIYEVILGTNTNSETINRAKLNDDNIVNAGDVSELYNLILQGE